MKNRKYDWMQWIVVWQLWVILQPAPCQCNAILSMLT